MAKYKVLKSVAHSFAHSFTSALNYRNDDYVMDHILRRARETGEGTLWLDMLSGEAGPPSLLTKPIAESLSAYSTRFPELVASHKTNIAYVRSARMTVAYDLSTTRPVSYAAQFLEWPYRCRVEIEDDRGKVWSAELEDWRSPEAGWVDAHAGGTLQRLFSRFAEFVRRMWI